MPSKFKLCRVLKLDSVISQTKQSKNVKPPFGSPQALTETKGSNDVNLSAASPVAITKMHDQTIFHGVESFADFVVREIALDIMNSVKEKLKQAAQEYISGGDTAADTFRGIYHLLLNEGVRVSYPQDPMEGMQDEIKTDEEIMSNMTGGEMFEQDLFSCFNELLYEYLSRNWDHIDELIDLNRGEGEKTTRKLKENIIQEPKRWGDLKKLYTRKRITDLLESNRKFRTMAAIMRSVGSKQKGKLVTINSSSNLSCSPTIVFLGGGMGAGKSTVVSVLKEQNEGIFNLNPVFIEADALKMIDPVFQALNKRENGANEVSQVVHGHSTNAANQQLLLALRKQRNIVMDGTMTWTPYVQQTIAMVRDAHNNDYRLGPGYIVQENEPIIEKYWELVEPAGKKAEGSQARYPYRIEMIGVTVDPEKAVARGLRRTLMTGRGVPVSGQLRSHRLFSENFESYFELLDKAMLFDTSEIGEPRKVAMKESGQSLWQEPSLYSRFLRKKFINENANGVDDLYLDNDPIVEFNREGITDPLKKTLLAARHGDSNLRRKIPERSYSKRHEILKKTMLCEQKSFIFDSEALEEMFND